jgi:hypothetical protein
LAKTKLFARNFWVWDDANNNFTTNDPGTFSFTPGTWRDLIITKLLAGDNADIFSVETLYALTGMCNRAQIKPFMIDGNPYHLIVINSFQERDLMVAGTFPTLVAQAGVRGDKNPLVAGAKYKWNGWIIYVNDNVARIPYIVTTSTIDFFTYSGGAEQVISGLNKDQPFETQQLNATDQDMACAVVIGSGCIGWAEAGKPRFTRETRDHESDTAVGIRIKYGMGLMNFYDHITPASASAMMRPQFAVVATHVK